MNKEIKITYIFGAGASAKAVPIVEQMPESIEIFKDFLKNSMKIRLSNEKLKLPDGTESKDTKQDLQMKLVSDLEWLCSEAKRHASVDTLAKKLSYIRNNEKLILLKSLLSCFLGYIQHQREVDPRYDSFFASILDLDRIKTNPIGENFKFLSWNYDCQFEKAFLEYTDFKKIHQIQTLLNVYPPAQPPKSDRSFLLKINGSALFLDHQGDNFENIIDDYSISNLDMVERIVYQYYVSTTRKNYIETSLSFAWEDRWSIDFFSDYFSSTDIVVIIGYSFPFFNREIDRKIFKNFSNLKKIYIQNQESKLDDVISRFQSACKSDYHSIVKPIISVDQFYIPAEL